MGNNASGWKVAERRVLVTAGWLARENGSEAITARNGNYVPRRLLNLHRIAVKSLEMRLDR